MTIEEEIKKEFARMNQPLTKKTNSFLYGNTAETWESLSQYGFTLAYYETQAQAEEHTINFYKKNMFLIRQ